MVRACANGGYARRRGIGTLAIFGSCHRGWPISCHSDLAAQQPALHAPPMLEPTAETCEVKSHGVWIAVSLEAAAIVYGRDVHRCPSCHGRVVILGGARGSNTTRAKYHSQPHDGCPLMPEAFSGRATLHPQALT